MRKKNSKNINLKLDKIAKVKLSELIDEAKFNVEGIEATYYILEFNMTLELKTRIQIK